ncbi:energy transducer TonB [Rheinheimera sp.]|uniref:energy transducer TonB n=1 Tax=Rheinheimera sp. TaxID=1869214 RepID=UPI002614A740|nr:TonB family protein [Rheinheimera sp.]MCA1928392.1 TonB family protein [Rheinheimera sp.]
MKRSASLFLLVLMVHLSLIAAVVSQTSEPQAKAVEKAIEGVIIPAPVAPQPEKPKPKPVQPEPLKKPKPTPQPQKKAEAKKAVTKPKPAKVTPAPLAEASAKAVSAPEPVADAAKTKTAAKAAEPEAAATPPVASANKALNKAPLYPTLSRRLKEQGTVYLQVLVLKNGKVGQLKLKQSSGFARLDQSAINAVRGWTYQPALKLGQPVDFWFVQPVVFNLNSIH